MARKRLLRDLPGFEASAAEVLERGVMLQPRDIRHAGIWSPPASIREVTPSLLYNLAIACRRHRWRLAREGEASATVVSLDTYRHKRAFDSSLSFATVPPYATPEMHRHGWEPCCRVERGPFADEVRIEIPLGGDDNA